MTRPSIPPPLRHLEADMSELHKLLRSRTEDGGSTYISHPGDLYASFQSLTRVLDMVPTIVGLLVDHMRAWEERGTLLLTPLTPADHTVAEGTEMMTRFAGSGAKAQEHQVRTLGALLMVLSHYAPNVAERGPDEPAMVYEDAGTTRDAIRHLQKQVTERGVKAMDGDYLDERWLYLMLQVIGTALQEGRRADAVQTMTDPKISDGTWLPNLLALMVDVAELVAEVLDNGREHLG